MKKNDYNFTKDELNIIKQFAAILAENIADSKKRNADRFYFELRNPETEREIIKVKLWGDAYKDVCTAQGFTDFIKNIAPYFVAAFKSEFGIAA